MADPVVVGEREGPLGGPVGDVAAGLEKATETAVVGGCSFIVVDAGNVQGPSVGLDEGHVDMDNLAMRLRDTERLVRDAFDYRTNRRLSAVSTGSGKGRMRLEQRIRNDFGDESVGSGVCDSGVGGDGASSSSAVDEMMLVVETAGDITSESASCSGADSAVAKVLKLSTVNVASSCDDVDSDVY